MAREVRFWVVFLGLGMLLFLSLFTTRTLATVTGNQSSANLTIYDSTDPQGGGGNRFSNINVSFFANFTNATGYVLNASLGTSTCQVRYNATEGAFTSWETMVYNASSLQWDSNRSFNYKGTRAFEINCSSTVGTVHLQDNYTISNTAPSVSLDQGGTFIDLDGNKLNIDRFPCTEDTLCTYNFTQNVTEIDLNDVLTFNHSSTNTTLTNFTVNLSTGILQVNITLDVNAGDKQIELNVRDSESITKGGILRVNVTAVNDLPTFVNLDNRSFNMSELFTFVFHASDEEVDLPLTFNITFLTCTTEEWSWRNSSSCNLFNSSQYTTNGSAINITFTPTRNDVGNYSINFTVRDLNNDTAPFNVSTSWIVNFTVLNVNVAPYFMYVCDNERNATEGTAFSCRINVTDNDETNNLTLTTNTSWFLNYSNVTVNSTTGFNGSFLVSFTANDTSVGNWSINITVNDTGDPRRINSTLIWFHVANVNDSVRINSLSNVTAYTSNNYTFYVNATDDDLLILDKNIYNEVLRFSSNLSWVSISSFSVLTNSNITMANITFDPNQATNGNHTVNITVNDSSGNKASTYFVISIFSNTAPAWSASTATNHTLTEGTVFFLNLSQNVSDSNGDALNFTFSNSSAFPSFSLNISAGLLNFTPVDSDVGSQLVVINATDGTAYAALYFNFTINNVHDSPLFETPITVTNATVDGSSNVSATEDNRTTIEFFVRDDDFRIPLGQKGFYNESLNLTLTIQGVNTTLFSFTKDSAFPTSTGASANRSHFSAEFAPRKADLGIYNITLQITDSNSNSISLRFNLTVDAINHAPDLIGGENFNSSILESVYLNFNSTDTEETNESVLGSNLTFSIRNLTSGGNFLTINSTTGVINFTFNQTYAGRWHFNVSVNDTNGLYDFVLFNISVYDRPRITLPNSSYIFSLIENSSSTLNFTVNHTMGDNANYTFYIDGRLRNSTISGVNGSAFLWNFTANFTDETTCTGNVLLRLDVTNAKLTNSTNWTTTIAHQNHPLASYANIGGGAQLVSSGSPLTLALSDYFRDFDASDTCTNQTIGFSYTLLAQGGSIISVSFTNWTNATTPQVVFSSSSAGTANYSITAHEINSSNTSQTLRTVVSNNFTVELTVSSSTTTTTSSGGGGGGVVSRPTSLKIIVPAPLFAKKGQHLKVPISVLNNGIRDLVNINLSQYVLKSLQLEPGVEARFNMTQIALLKAGEKVNVTLFVDIITNETGRYDVVINGSVKDLQYSNWEELYIHIREEDIQDKIIFAEELIVGNPECAEIKELLDEAKRLYEEGLIEETSQKLNEAIEACKKAITQPPRLRFSPDVLEGFVFNRVLLWSLAAFLLGILYYYFSRRRLRKGHFEEEALSPFSYNERFRQ